MARALLRKAIATTGLAAALFTAPAAAQMMSEGYEFLKAVRDRDGTAVTEALSQPGSVVVNARDITSGESALHIVTERRDAVWIRFLTQKGANPNVRDKRGNSPLSLAVSLGFVEGAKELIEAGARVDETNATGETPLIVAIHRRDTAMVETLLENGASPDRTDNSGRSARDYAAMPGTDPRIAKAIADADARRGDDGGATYGPRF
ncbi:ankyrin repeat domain-containing protein [Pelagerythrobacter marinus]|nr:ankyrin repeat domain-containing protein [Pelagerythrobacter marinus]MEC9066659.1 ankyrin repeat domain-containing protein [Pseudomonadota bacterium]USA38681.1 ankyrin repeat domain-containing protein [Pelagerythrobacter marinus]WPZ07292.1 ankyrin repeat domain-containing protein [Pelagerythrobacter marinus]